MEIKLIDKDSGLPLYFIREKMEIIRAMDNYEEVLEVVEFLKTFDFDSFLFGEKILKINERYFTPLYTKLTY